MKTIAISLLLLLIFTSSVSVQISADNISSSRITLNASTDNTVSKRDCNEILLSGEKDIIKTYRDCIFQNWLESSPWSRFYNNSRLNDNAGIINNEREIINLLDSLGNDGIDITLVAINEQTSRQT